MPLEVMKSSQCCSFFDYVAHETNVWSVLRAAAIRRTYANYFVFSINHAIRPIRAGRENVSQYGYTILSLQTEVSLERQRK